MDVTTALRNNYVFRGVPLSAVNLLAATADLRTMHGGETIVRQFERGKDLFILLEGEAVTRNFHGEVIARFGPGSMIGEMALVDGAPRSANVVTVGECQVAKIPYDAIEGLVAADAEAGKTLYHNISKVLSRRLRSMNDQSDDTPAGSR